MWLSVAMDDVREVMEPDCKGHCGPMEKAMAESHIGE